MQNLIDNLTSFDSQILLSRISNTTSLIDLCLFLTSQELSSLKGAFAFVYEFEEDWQNCFKLLELHSF